MASLTVNSSQTAHNKQAKSASTRHPCNTLWSSEKGGRTCGGYGGRATDSFTLQHTKRIYTIEVCVVGVDGKPKVHGLLTTFYHLIWQVLIVVYSHNTTSLHTSVTAHCTKELQSCPQWKLCCCFQMYQRTKSVSRITMTCFLSLCGELRPPFLPKQSYTSVVARPVCVFSLGSCICL